MVERMVRAATWLFCRRRESEWLCCRTQTRLLTNSGKGCCICCSDIDSRPPHHRKPRFRPAFAEVQVLQVRNDLDPLRLERFDGPTGSEGLLQLLLRDSPWPIGARLFI